MDEREASGTEDIEVLFKEGVRRLEEGSLQAAATAFTSALAQANPTSLPGIAAPIALNLGTALEELNDLERARETLDNARAWFAAAGDELGTAESDMALGVVLERTGDAPAAVAHYRSARERFSSAGEQTYAALALANEGGAWETAGKLDHAARAYREAARELVRVGANEEASEIRARLAAVLP